MIETRLAIMELLKCDADGWVPIDAYEVGKDLLPETYVEYIATASDQEHDLTEEKTMEVWSLTQDEPCSVVLLIMPSF
jgi:hypothetical protein